jgi:hypothetical protein
MPYPFQSDAGSVIPPQGLDVMHKVFISALIGAVFSSSFWQRAIAP